MLALRREQLEKCVYCPKFDDCILLNKNLPEIPPDKVLKWFRENCPHKPRVKFVPIK